MVDANLKIIEELKQVLNKIAGDKELRQLVISSAEAFSRNRKLTLQRLVGIIINLPKRSLSIEIREFFEVLTLGEYATKGAFCLQRSKLLPVFFQIWNQFLVDGFYKYYGDNVELWKGFRLLAVDGSLAYLINKKELADYFGTHENQHYPIPMARVMQTYDVLNKVIVKGGIYPIKQSEQKIIANQVEHLFENSLTLFDRAFASFELMYLMMSQEKPRHFVIRCKNNFNVEVSSFMKSEKSSEIVEVEAGKYAVRQLRKRGYRITPGTTIKVRMVKIKLSTGEIELLLTNLYNANTYTLKTLKYIYNLRWGIETCYGIQKNQLQMEQFSGHRAICIQQDFAANIFVTNLQSLIEKQCVESVNKANLRRKHKYKVNKNITWAALKNNIVKLFIKENTEEILRRLQNIFEQHLEPIRPNRKYERVAKTRRLRGKYQTLTNYKRAI
ncbi:MAG: IS4 family transposase [Bacteroidetes bacterium]|nr:IS4 family transposase [Bacteroidota bacterium]